MITIRSESRPHRRKDETADDIDPRYRTHLTRGEEATHHGRCRGTGRRIATTRLPRVPKRPRSKRGDAAHVLRAADELGYQPDTAARVLRRARSGHIGVLFTMRHPHDVALVDAIYPAAERMGYDIALGATGPSRDERKAVGNLLAYRVEGLIVIGPYIDPTAMAQLAQRIPVVEISRRIDVAGVDSVRTADDKGVRLAVDHLVELGHTSIAYVGGGAMPGANERRKGYRAAMRRHGLADALRVITGDYTEESGARAARELLDTDSLPTAVIAGNDRCAIGMLGAFSRLGVNVPGDVSMVGYDDSEPAQRSYIDYVSRQAHPEWAGWPSPHWPSASTKDAPKVATSCWTPR